MSAEFTSFLISESAKRKSRITAYTFSIALIAIVSWGAVAVLYSLKSRNLEMDASGKMLASTLMVLTVMLWSAWVVAIGMATVRDRRWFATISGALSLAANSLHIGTINIDRSSIVSGHKTRRHLLIRYRSDGKPRRIALPLSWLPTGAADQIVRSIEDRAE